jgi:hypothetical protein
MKAFKEESKEAKCALSELCERDDKEKKKNCWFLSSFLTRCLLSFIQKKKL